MVVNLSKERKGNNLTGSELSSNILAHSVSFVPFEFFTLKLELSFLTREKKVKNNKRRFSSD